MKGPDKTGLFLLIVLGQILVWEAYALYWLEDGSTISQVLGRLLRLWPPLLLLLGLLFMGTLWHFWEAGEP